jgi:hypothetical protein
MHSTDYARLWLVVWHVGTPYLKTLRLNYWLTTYGRLKMASSDDSILENTIYTISIVDGGQEYVWCSYENEQDAISARDEMKSRDTTYRQFYVTKTRLIRSVTS